MTGAELRQLRHTTGPSQERFAVLILGVTNKTVSRWETGGSPIGSLTAAGIEAKTASYLEKKKS